MAKLQRETRAAIAAARRAEVLAELDAGLTCTEVARRHGIAPQSVYALRRHLPGYLDDPAFREPHTGPPVLENCQAAGRDPSSDQIRRRCEAIRRAVPRAPQGLSAEWELPLVAQPVVQRPAAG